MSQESVPDATETKKCPKCHEDIQKQAVKCKHCGENLRGWVRRHPILSALIFIMVLPMSIATAFSSPRTTEVPSERPGQQTVYDRIAGLTDCSTLQQEFDLAEAHGKRNHQNGKIDLARISTSYMVAVDEQMQKIGCYR